MNKGLCLPPAAVATRSSELRLMEMLRRFAKVRGRGLQRAWQLTAEDFTPWNTPMLMVVPIKAGGREFVMSDSMAQSRRCYPLHRSQKDRRRLVERCRQRRKLLSLA